MRNLLLCLLVAQSVLGGPRVRLSQWVIDSWNMESGLPNNTVTSIEQTKDGYLWLAMGAGIAQFDGVKATLFDRSRIPGLGTNIFNGVRMDGQGQLWAAPMEPGLLRWDGAKWNRIGTEAGLPPREIEALHVGPKGRLWAAAFKGGLFEWDGARFNPVNTLMPLPPSSVTRILKASDGSIWLGTAEHGAIRWRSNEWTVYDRSSGLSSNAIWTILEPTPGSIFLGGKAGVDAIVDGKLDPKSIPEGLAGKVIEDAIVLPGGEMLWATFRDGLLKTSKAGIEQLRVPSMLFEDPIRTMFIDREGSIWLGTHSGLHRLSVPRVLFYSTQEGIRQNLYSKMAMAPDGRIYNADTEGNIWMGPIGEQRIWATHPAKDPDQDLLGVTRDGRAWIRDSKNVLYSIESGVYRKTKFPEGHIAGALLETAHGEIWIGTRTGSHFRSSGAGWAEVQPKMPLSRTGVNVMAEDRSGAIYVGTRSGLARFSNGVWRTWSKTNGLPSNLITALCLSQDGVAWIGTASGIVRMDGDKLLVIDKSMGLPHEAITTLTLNKEGDLWVASHAGVFRVAKDELNRLIQRKAMKKTPAVFNAKDGLKNPEGRPYGGSWIGDDGSVWMLMMQGLARVNPDSISINPLVPETKVQGVFIDGKRAESLENLVLSSSANRLEFQFTALSLLRPERNRFRFRLVGFDKQWIDAGRQRSAVYTGLKGGSYRFEVIGANSDNIESAIPAVVTFEKTKTFIETPLFLALLLVVAVALLWVGMQMRIRGVQARHQITLAERQRIARELHDGLLQEFQGATYALAALQLNHRDNSVGVQLDVLISGLEKSLRESRGAIQTLRGRQWDGVELYPALVECAEGLCHAAQVKVRCERSFSLPEPAANIKDAFWQIAREAIRNSLKHGNPTEVQLSLSSRGNELLMLIQDDGCGFDHDKVKSLAGPHFGLASMEERAKAVGGILSIASETGNGSRVQVRLSL